MAVLISEDLISDGVEEVSKNTVNMAGIRMIQDQLFRIFPVEGVGSGVIIDKNGYSLTNNHVIEGARRLRITLTDGMMLNGKVVGKDETTDLAVVRLEGISDSVYHKNYNPRFLVLG